MNPISIYALKALRMFYTKVFQIKPLPRPECEQDPGVVSKIIYEKLMDDEPCMIARFGAFELSTIVNYTGIKQHKGNIWKYISGKSLPWWWNERLLKSMQTNAGFFPTTPEKVKQFCELMLKDMKEIDILGSWLTSEKYVEENLNYQKVHLRLLEPFWTNQPWTKVLENKKVLVVHPFAETIKRQYEKRKLLFKNTDILPDFASLSVIKAVQTLGISNHSFPDWFAALESMEKQIEEVDFDICLIGAGAYGFPLAAYVKRIGKKAIHWGGSLQLLFGIKGKRWEDPNYGVKEWGIPKNSYASLMNEYWVRPSDNEKPGNANKVEGACYW